MKPLLQTPLALFIVQALLIVSASRLIGLLARRMRQPMVIAEIVAGIVLGPSVLGLAAPGLAAAVFPRDSLGLISMFSQVGLILFMFLVGLEFDGTMLRGRGHTSVVISHTSIIVPFALGAVLARYLYPRLSPPTVPFSSFTLFMGAAMSITAFPDRKSTRLNSSHSQISYAVFCLKKKKKNQNTIITNNTTHCS